MNIVGTLIDAGKVDDLKALVCLSKAGLVALDHDVAKHMEEMIQVKVRKYEEQATNEDKVEVIDELMEVLKALKEILLSEPEEEVKPQSDLLLG